MKKSIKSALVQAGAVLAVAIVATVLHKTGYISQDTTTRVLMISIGLVIAWQSNATPKAEPTASPRKQAINRLTGWAFMLSGLGYAAIWAFMPIGPANPWSMIVIGAAGVTVLVYCLTTRGRSAKIAD
jgi:hypothetical protein